MSEILLNQLIEKLDEVLLGRRDIISEIEKLRDAIEKIQNEKKDIAEDEITNTVNEIKIFMSKSTNVLSELNNNMRNLQTLINSFNDVFNKISNTINIEQSLHTSEISQIPQKSLEIKFSSLPKPQGESISPRVPEKLIGNIGDSDFKLILSIAKSNNPAVDIAVMLEKVRMKLENENPLNPILFELSMESRRLRSLGNTTLSASNLQMLVNKIQKWMS